MSQAQRLQELKGPIPAGMPPVPTAAVASPPSVSSKTTAKSATKKEKDKKEVSLLSGLPYNTLQQKQRLDKCDWVDRVIYASRMLLGGNNVNGFLRGTATAQRIKKQRARQVGITKKSASSAPGSMVDGADADKKDKKSIFNQEEEEKLKKDIMNPRTVKKLKCELEASLQFCAQLHNLIRSVIFDVDSRQSPYLPPYLVIEGDQPSIPAPTVSSIPPVPKQPVPVAAAPPPVAAAPAPDNSTMPWAVRGRGQPPQVASKTNPPKAQPPSQSTASPGNPEGSTLRKLRKKKLPPNTEPPVNLPEFDNAGRRLVPKKDHNIRLFEVLRFRALRQGDFVAARTTSRDLWILARVMKDYPGIDSVSPLEFIQLSESRRDALFREKVHVKDVEDKDGDNFFQVTRNLILPLPRTYSEAADWGSRIKKGMRVYSMYPNTTSLYPATVFDSTTYCRDDDDIIVVEFDGEEPDETGVIPKYHIPARFVSLIPKEFPSSEPPTANKSNKRKSASSPPGNAPKQAKTDDFLNFDFDGNFDALDLDFDKPLGGDEEDDGGFPPLL